MSRQEERAVTIPTGMGSGAQVLEGLYIAGRGDEPPGLVVAPPHPLYGGSMDSPVVNEVSWACRQRGVASLRFNWRGVGASAGAPSGEPADADEDYRAALDQLAESVGGPLTAAGYSFGAAAAVRVGVSHARVHQLLLVAPPPAMLDVPLLAGFEGSVLLVVGEHDQLAPVAEVEKLADRLAAARVVVVPEADHFFIEGLAEVGRAAEAWIAPAA